MSKFVFISQTLSELRKNSKTTHKVMYKRLLDEYDRYKEMELPALHPKKSTTYMGIAIVNLALLYLISEDEKYLKEAKRWMFTVVNYEKWGNAHLVNVDLSASWILFGLSLGYQWLNPFLTDNENKIIKEKLILQATIMYDYKINTAGQGWSTNYWQNHNWINMTGLACAGYALEDEYQDAKVWIEESKENFKIVFDMLADDGSNYEGVVYWRYGGMWLFVYAHLLKQMEGIDYFKQSNYLKNTFYYRLYQANPNLEEIINFGDCHDTRSGHSTAVYYKIASEYKNGHAAYLGDLVQSEFLMDEQYKSQVKPGILPEACFEYLWYDPKVEKKDFSDLPLHKYFPDLGLIVLRSSWEKDAKHFSFKCGYPGGKKQWINGWKMNKDKGYKSLSLSHHHPDNNSFVFVNKNEYVVVDEGYNRNILPDDHNNITVDGKLCFTHDVNDVYMRSIYDMIKADPNTDPLQFKGDITSFNEKQGVYVFSGETSGIYDPSLKLTVNERTVFTSSNGYFLLIDTLNSDIKHQYTFNLHVGQDVDIKGDHILLNEALREIVSIYPKEKHIDFTKKTIRAVMTTQEPDNFREVVLNRLSISNKEKANDCHFVNLLDVDHRIKTIKSMVKDDIMTIDIIGDTFEDKIIYNQISRHATYKSKTNDQLVTVEKVLEQ